MIARCPQRLVCDSVGVPMAVDSRSVATACPRPARTGRRPRREAAGCGRRSACRSRRHTGPDAPASVRRRHLATAEVRHGCARRSQGKQLPTSRRSGRFGPDRRSGAGRVSGRPAGRPRRPTGRCRATAASACRRGTAPRSGCGSRRAFIPVSTRFPTSSNTISNRTRRFPPTGSTPDRSAQQAPQVPAATASPTLASATAGCRNCRRYSGPLLPA